MCGKEILQGRCILGILYEAFRLQYCKRGPDKKINELEVPESDERFDISALYFLSVVLLSDMLCGTW